MAPWQRNGKQETVNGYSWLPISHVDRNESQVFFSVLGTLNWEIRSCYLSCFDGVKSLTCIKGLYRRCVLTSFPKGACFGKISAMPTLRIVTT